MLPALLIEASEVHLSLKKEPDAVSQWNRAASCLLAYFVTMSCHLDCESSLRPPLCRESHTSADGKFFAWSQHSTSCQKDTTCLNQLVRKEVAFWICKISVLWLQDGEIASVKLWAQSFATPTIFPALSQHICQKSDGAAWNSLHRWCKNANRWAESRDDHVDSK